MLEGLSLWDWEINKTNANFSGKKKIHLMKHSGIQEKILSQISFSLSSSSLNLKVSNDPVTKYYFSLLRTIKATKKEGVN